MRALLLAGAILTGAVAAQAAAAPKRSAAPAARDWTRTVSATPEGGYRVGNPAAAVKLVEYGSLTCNHCATFAKEGMPPLLSRHVRTGRVSYEFRPSC
jgi:protein-disulfide isomerase